MEPTPESIELMPTTSVQISLNTRKISIASWNVNNATGRRLFILRKLQKRSEVIRKVIKPDVIVLQEISSPLAVKQMQVSKQKQTYTTKASDRKTEHSGFLWKNEHITTRPTYRFKS